MKVAFYLFVNRNLLIEFSNESLHMRTSDFVFITDIIYFLRKSYHNIIQKKIDKETFNYSNSLIAMLLNYKKIVTSKVNIRGHTCIFI